MYPIERIETILDKIGHSKYFSSLDCSCGFLQIPLDLESSYKCGVITERATYRMTHLAFGLRNSSSIFSRVMSQMLSGLSEHVLNYVDDIVCHSQTFPEHLLALRSVFERFREYNMMLNPKKCILANEEMTFLGHRVRGDGYTPDVTNIEKIKNFPRPTNLQE
ncbi:enzymatic polyprotein, partial [Aphelenchoides avenae]